MQSIAKSSFIIPYFDVLDNNMTDSKIKEDFVTLSMGNYNVKL